MTQAETGGSALRALVIDPTDNVANLIGPGAKGRRVSCKVEGRNEVEEIELLDELPSNHKLARRDIEQGEPILKYGLQIGTASKPIRKGEHVHAHNVESNRGRGDLKNTQSEKG